MLCSKLLRHENRGRLAAWIDDRFGRLEARYAGALDRVLRRPLVPARRARLVPCRRRRPVLHPPVRAGAAEDAGILSAQLSAPEGTGYARDGPLHATKPRALMPLVGKGAVRTVIARVPGGFGASDDFNNASLSVFLKPWEERDKTTADVVKVVNQKLAQLPAVRGNAAVRSSLNRGRGQPINFVIAGSTYEDLARARDRIIAAAQSNPGILNLDSDYKETKPQLRIDVDTARAGDLGVSVQDVQRAPEPARLAPGLDLCRPRRGISGHRPGRGRSPFDRGQSRHHLCAQPHRRPRPALQPGHDARDGGRARPRPLQQAARDHPLRRPRPRLLARRGARLHRGAGGPGARDAAVGYRGESQSFKEAGGSI
jgi:multidrug efflux pump